MNTKSKWTKLTGYMLVAVMLVGTATTTRAADKKTAEKGAAPKIQMAILLDTSGSMKGLINQARTQLWKIVNEFTAAERGGMRPLLEVALIEYGHASLGAEKGFMRQVVPLTDNLDQVSEELFKLEIGGSLEYCGQAIDLAAKQLKWSESNKDLKCIFIAGNEPFTQGTVDFRKACHEAANKGITVSTIYCGVHDEGVKTMWLEASKLADGSYMSIDQNKAVPFVAAPQDKQLAELSAKLNTTYLAYGTAKDRKEAVERQVAQDSNAAKANQAVAALRAQVKGSRLYNNARWDLCDACRLGKIKLEDLKEDQLPEFMKKMTLEQRKAYVEKKSKERIEIQTQIKSLSEARQKHVAVELKKLAADGEQTLDVAIINAARDQATAKNFSFEKKE